MSQDLRVGHPSSGAVDTIHPTPIISLTSSQGAGCPATGQTETCDRFSPCHNQLGTCSSNPWPRWIIGDQIDSTAIFLFLHLGRAILETWGGCGRLESGGVREDTIIHSRPKYPREQH
ncbi:hypothetical protein RRG08_012350 [Elysia crispata]|uniref:Uncharacterized protein n=1 Tax=Elysia crispata TaxID=231223 RepID=A0AAE1AD96_9GAST|nr:hypothetical protein RRG08_012350 [Elysia crispata]